MACIECLRGFHEECVLKPCCCGKEEEKEDSTPIFSEVIDQPIEIKRSVGRPVQEVIGVSAGRKRAAEIYGNEMGIDKPCEWRGMANCGGGKFPIIGCLSGTREHIHHGPNKDTSHNERNNVSLICTLCHNRWHAANDKAYEEDPEAYKLLPKQPRVMSIEETLKAVAHESNRKKKVEKD